MQVRSGTCSTTPSSCRQPPSGNRWSVSHMDRYFTFHSLFSNSIGPQPPPPFVAPAAAACQRVVQFHSNPPPPPTLFRACRRRRTKTGKGLPHPSDSGSLRPLVQKQQNTRFSPVVAFVWWLPPAIRGHLRGRGRQVFLRPFPSLLNTFEFKFNLIVDFSSPTPSSFVVVQIQLFVWISSTSEKGKNTEFSSFAVVGNRS